MTIESEVEKYCNDVLTGGWACRTVVHAVMRYKRDLERVGDDDFPYVMNWKQVKARVLFTAICKHYKGEWAGRPITLEPWQLFIYANVFGFVHKDTGKRRFRYAHLEIPRKNGKSLLAAVMALTCFVLDREGGAEAYSVASKRDQARIVHNDAKQIVKKSPELSKLIKVQRDNLFIDDIAARFEPLGANADTMDGLNPHVVVVDELHAHKNGDVWSVMETGMGARSQPLMIAATTAGHNSECFGAETRKMSESIIDPDSDMNDDRWFSFISSASTDDDWTKESTWRKANPNYGISVSAEDMLTQCRKAQNMPSVAHEFKVKRLNLWLSSSEAFLNIVKWDACPTDMPPDEELARMTCVGGLDLSSTIDLSAFCMAFRDAAGDVYAKWWHWMPEETAAEREREDRVPYRKWAREGLVELTPGNVIDYRYIRQRIAEEAERYQPESVGYDPYNAQKLCLELSEEDGLEMIQVRQGAITLSGPTKDLEKLVVSASLHHGGNPLIRWQAGNLAVKRDANDNIRPVKEGKRVRIDGMVALINALAVLNVTEDLGPSMFEDGSYKDFEGIF